MKKFIAKLGLLMSMLVLFLFACGKQETAKDTSSATSSTSQESKAEESTSELKKIKVASHTAPMTDMLELVKEDAKKDGYEIEIVAVTDNVQANVALKNGEVDANFFQHEPFMQQFNKGNDGNLIAISPVYNALVAFYSKDYKSLDELPDGAVVAIPNDPTNIARALRLLATGGLIELDDKDSYEITEENITKNPKNLQFKQWGLLNLNEAFQESDLTFNYPTYIAKLDLKPETDGLIVEEDTDQTFAIQLVARENNKDSEEVQELKKLLNSDKIREFIETKLKGHAKVAF